MEHIKKILGLNIYFKLEDNFNEGVPGALRQLADFLETETDTLDVGDKKKEVRNPKEIWDKFLLIGKRFIGDVTLSELVDNEWIPLDKKINN